MEKQTIEYHIVAEVHYGESRLDAVNTIKDEYKTCSPINAYSHVKLIKEKLPQAIITITEVKSAVTSDLTIKDLEKILKE